MEEATLEREPMEVDEKMQDEERDQESSSEESEEDKSEGFLYEQRARTYHPEYLKTLPMGEALKLFASTQKRSAKTKAQAEIFGKEKRFGEGKKNKVKKPKEKVTTKKSPVKESKEKTQKKSPNKRESDGKDKTDKKKKKRKTKEKESDIESDLDSENDYSTKKKKRSGKEEQSPKDRRSKKLQEEQKETEKEGKKPKKESRRGKNEKHPYFEKISGNSFVERKAKKLKSEDVSVCECTNIPGIPGCLHNCINRMTFTECTKNHCRTGDNCTNMRFQKRRYAKVAPVKSGPKGWGLQALENIKADQFIIEYVGEVVSFDACQKRMEDKEKYQDNHVYFLTLDGNECIDAHDKGNFARFVNHSCNPNCYTQKWFAAGETRVGIFALKDISKGTELTFDYKFERFGPKKQICYCGESNCRGFLGEKPKQLKKKEKPKPHLDAKTILFNKINKGISTDPQYHLRRSFFSTRSSYNEPPEREEVKKRKKISEIDFTKKSEPVKFAKLPFLQRNVERVKQIYREILSEMKEEVMMELEEEDEDNITR